MRPLKASNSDINPLIDENGDTATVSAALDFISKAFAQVEADDGMPLDFDECFGLSMLLRSCSAALDAMNKPSFPISGGDGQ